MRMKPLQNVTAQPAAGSEHGKRKIGSFAVIFVLLAVAITSSACGQKQSPAPGTDNVIAQTAVPAGAAAASAMPATGDELFAQGNTFSAAGQFDEAEAAYKQAIAIDPNKASYWQNLGVTYYQLQRLSDAEQSLKTGLQLAPDDAQLNYLLGIIYLQMARYSDSGVYLLKANELDPNLPEPYYGLGVLYRQQGKRDEAIRAFERFLELGPGQDPSAIPNAQAELDALRAGQ